ncbi:MAG TPA: rubrerythrin [Prolixibacteraceae bacterium]|jgi:rubrerythrin|nr:rubrerythrin [Prolixibacteraceae bacterium]
MKKLIIIASIFIFILTNCKQPQQVKTIEDLKAGIKGEITATVKYAAYALKAREEANLKIATLFDAVSKAESIHAANHLKILEALGGTLEKFTPQYEVNTTAENLQASIEGETYEATTMYPQFLIDAKAEKAEKAVKSFTWALDTEKKHQELYTEALKALNMKAENTLPTNYAICPVCGNTYDKAKLDGKCSFCQTRKGKFIVL